MSSYLNYAADDVVALCCSIMLQGVHFSDCKTSELEITGYNSLDAAGALEFGDEAVFNTYPHFCGKEIISPQAISVNQGYYNPKVSLVYKEKNVTQPDYFEFYYAVRKFFSAV